MELSRSTVMLLDKIKMDFPGVSEADVQFDDQVEWTANMLVVRLRARLLTRRGEVRSLDIGPATIRGILWEKFAPRWALERWPVKHRFAHAKPIIAYPKGVECLEQSMPDIEWTHVDPIPALDRSGPEE